LEKVQIVTYGTDKLITGPHAVILLFPHQNFLYVLADALKLQILTEDSMATTN